MKNNPIHRGMKYSLGAMLSLSIVLSSCQPSKDQSESERPEAYSFSSAEVSDNTLLSSTQVSQPDIQEDNDSISIDIKDDIRIIDHNRAEASVFQIEVGDEKFQWDGGSHWKLNSIILNWCRGATIHESEIRFDGNPYPEGEEPVDKKCRIPKEKALENIYNTSLIQASDINHLEEISNSLCDRTTADAFLSWNLSLEGYPWEFYDGLEWFTVPQNVNSVQYIRLTPFIDGIPLADYGTLSNCPTFEWKGILQPSGYGRTFADYPLTYINENNQCLDVTQYSFSIKKTVMSQQPIVPAEKCYQEIEKALSYDPTFVRDKKVTVYCMELTYGVFDEFPLMSEDNDRDQLLIPVWTVYVSLVEDEKVTYGTTMINAITGKSMFSDTIPPNSEKYYVHTGEG